MNVYREAENWLREKKQQQDSLPKYANPVLLSAEIRKKAEAVDRYLFYFSLIDSISLRKWFLLLLFLNHLHCLFIYNRFCKRIMMKPKPVKPTTPETPAAPPPQDGEQQQPQIYHIL